MPTRFNGQNDSISEVDSAVEAVDEYAMNGRAYIPHEPEGVSEDYLTAGVREFGDYL